MNSTRPSSTILLSFHGNEATFVSVFRPTPGSEELLLHELALWTQASRGEAGCLLFDLYRVTGSSRVLYLHEVWEDSASFEAHASGFATSRFRAGAARHLERPMEAFGVEEIL